MLACRHPIGRGIAPWESWAGPPGAAWLPLRTVETLRQPRNTFLNAIVRAPSVPVVRHAAHEGKAVLGGGRKGALGGCDAGARDASERSHARAHAGCRGGAVGLVA